MADIDKELNDIKKAVYGKEVRGSIHDGIQKINEESEESKQKADEAHEITQDLLDETFDSAALEANFEQRLDDEIANLQPEWTQFKDDTVAQLAHNEQQIDSLDSSKLSKAEGATKYELQQTDSDIRSYLAIQLYQIGNMTPKGAYTTLQELENAYPNGSEGVYIVQSEGHWYFWNGSSWTDGGLYQAMPWDEFMTEQDEEWVTYGG